MKKLKHVKVVLRPMATNKQEDRLAHVLWCKDRGITPPKPPREAIKRSK